MKESIADMLFSANQIVNIGFKGEVNMNKRERVINALNCLPVDRPPVGFWFHFPDEQALGQACIDAHLDYYNHVDVDMAKIMCDSYFAYPITIEIKDASDWANLKPLGKDHPYIREQVERVKGVKAGLKDDMFVYYNIIAPFSAIRNGTSDEMIMEHLRKDPDALMHALDAIAEDLAVLAELCITEAGCDGVYLNVQGGEKERFTLDEYQNWIRPSDLKVINRANALSDYNILHCCGWSGIPNRLENWQDYPAKAVNWAIHIENLSIAEGQAFFGGRAVLGGFDNRRTSLIINGSKEEVKAFVKQLAQAVPTGLLIGADCTLPGGQYTDRISWVVEAAKELAE